ncbi:MATE family efflux transporter [Clostridiaceae bacterium DONG20-135]|uniref:Probable multidrug resistance protein NorM n=1 Tax=Copranaerobaculum intestinale TaxID=2692629 RepID=A0A6N8U7N8_9FIRM|nr:MATE family efflux transporter [Copranaerobaculum intestinale]MXQ72559.1 MATE family efflux transporter [Copranaerobaculum intestinale]
MKKSVNNLAEGNLYRSLIAFAVPFLIANFIQILYGAVDLAIVGRFTNDVSVAAVSVGSQVTALLVSLITGLTMGSTVLVAQYIGAGKEQDVKETVATTFTLFILAAVVFTIIMFLFTPQILELIQTPGPAMADAKNYVYICSAGIFFIFGYNAVSAVLRGMGDANSPVLFIGIACISNIVLDLLLVGGMGMGAAGAAFATMLSQGISLVLSIAYLRSKEFVFDFRLRSFVIQKEKAVKLIKIGIPVSLQETISAVSFLFIAAIVNTFGVTAAAAVGICTKFEGFAMLPSTAMAGAISTVAAQNIGAGKPQRAKRAMWISIGFALGASFVFFVWGRMAPDTIMRIFTDSKSVITAGSQYLHWFSVDFLLVAFGFTMNGFFNGCGRTFFAMVNGIAASIFIRIPLTYLFAHLMEGDLTGIGAAIPMATAVSVIAGLIYLRMGRWKRQLI